MFSFFGNILIAQDNGVDYQAEISSGQKLSTNSTVSFVFVSENTIVSDINQFHNSKIIYENKERLIKEDKKETNQKKKTHLIAKKKLSKDLEDRLKKQFVFKYKLDETNNSAYSALDKVDDAVAIISSYQKGQKILFFVTQLTSTISVDLKYFNSVSYYSIDFIELKSNIQFYFSRPPPVFVNGIA